MLAFGVLQFALLFKKTLLADSLPVPSLKLLRIAMYGKYVHFEVVFLNKPFSAVAKLKPSNVSMPREMVFLQNK